MPEQDKSDHRDLGSEIVPPNSECWEGRSRSFVAGTRKNGLRYCGPLLTWPASTLFPLGECLTLHKALEVLIMGFLHLSLRFPRSRP